MFFSTYVLTKKGPLAKVWLAAHWDRRLTRNEVKVVDLSQTIVHIVRPVVPIALRTSGELLVGVVRIYALKVRHLLKEATEATLFLRVITMKGASSTTSVGGGSMAAGAGTLVDKKTATSMQGTTVVDGVLVSSKGDIEAVTFDWSADAKPGSSSSISGAFPEAAEALVEAHFDTIADLLKTGGADGAQKRGGAPSPAEEAALAAAWYTVEPASQAVEEQHSTQQDYDEIARMRADLMAFGERSSESTSKSKSSLGSIEKGRGSIGMVVDGAIPFPPMTDEIDIGVALPEEMQAEFPGLNSSHQQQQEQADLAGMMLPSDPFTLPDMLVEGQQQQAGRAVNARKMRPTNVLDLAATTIARETVEKNIADRSDILTGEPRRGPLDEEEERDRYTVVGAANPTDPIVLAAATAFSSGSSSGSVSSEFLSIADAAPLSGIASPALRVAYAATLRTSIAEAVANAISAQQQLYPDGRRDGLTAEEQAAGYNAAGHKRMRGDGDAEEQLAGPAGDEAQAAAEEAETAVGGLAASALHTLERIRDAAARGATEQQKKRIRRDDTATLVGIACTLKAVTRQLHRRDAARAFVDLLALASKQYVSVRQEVPAGDVQIVLTEASASISGRA